IISQRLIRLLCPHCKKEVMSDVIDSKLLKVNEPIRIYNPVGCEQCDNTGYRGRISVLEALTIEDELDELIAKRATLGELKECASRSGYKTLADDAIRIVIEGRTSLPEVSRVIDMTQRLK
ncbi:MAG: secretion system protein E, partial [Gammaproteobacteria bacterium]|nr:secretion system protein E [Gammaproteobacteria bacterium]